MTQPRIIYLIDASVYIFRAWHSIPDHMKTPQGQPCNAVFGFAGFLADLLRRTHPAPVLVAFDASLSSSFRNEIYPEYKANRPPAPEELKRQFAWCQELCSALGLHWQADQAWEADDLIGTWSAMARKNAHQVCIVSRDKDLTQLIQPGDLMWDFAADTQMDSDGVQERFGVWPEQIADYLALMGDSVDNIPGVAGVGPKAASALLQAFGDLDAVYERLDEVPNLPVRGAKSLRDKLERDRDMALMSRKLTGIPLDIPLEIPYWHRKMADAPALTAMCDALGFGPGMRTRLLPFAELSE
ncbi:MAG: 5'-3' exonuclease [Oceanococcus sp.]